MSLNKTLDRLFDEIRREAKRNPEFADRLDAVLRLHDSRRDVPDEVTEDVASAATQSSPARGGGGERSEPEGQAAPSSKSKRRGSRLDASWTAGVSPANPGAAEPKAPARTPAVQERPALNPAGLYKKEGEDALTSALAGQDLSALRALVAEHNLDPSGVTPSLTRDELAAHIVAQAKRRAERDEKMFDY
jgi:hypothetical protein